MFNLKTALTCINLTTRKFNTKSVLTSTLLTREPGRFNSKSVLITIILTTKEPERVNSKCALTSTILATRELEGLTQKFNYF